MSITILHKGIYDTIQDKGRYGYQDIGIQPAGYLDFFSARLANAILGNPINQACIEVFFPAASFQFNASYQICITGAHFVPLINAHGIPMNHKVQVYAGDILSFLEPQKGNVAYIAIDALIDEQPWLDSYSESNKFLKNKQVLLFHPCHQIKKNELDPTSIEKITDFIFDNAPLHFLPGPAWEDLEEDSIQQFLNAAFTISTQANRMGFPLKGPLLQNKRTHSYLSSGVTRGTIQLLPSGELIILMADHQTIGGYANIGQINLVDLPRLAQWNKQNPLRFKMSSIDCAHSKYREIQQLLIH